MLINLLWGIHLINCVILIIVVLLQAGKGSTVGLSIGSGSSQTVFGSSGGKSFFARLTSVLAVVFMVTSVLLSISSSRRGQSYRGVMQNLPSGTETTETNKPAAPQPAAPVENSKPISNPRPVPAGK